MPSSNDIEKRLTQFGWARQIAGDDDYNKAIKAIQLSFQHNRGLWVVGVVGVGKTAFLNAFRKAMGSSPAQQFYCKEDADLLRLSTTPNEYLERNVYIDDIGTEEIIKQYGNTKDVIGDFIQLYHHRGKGNFYFTTNSDSRKLESDYGSRVVSRLLDMCVVLKFEGQTKRKVIVAK